MEIEKQLEPFMPTEELTRVVLQLPQNVEITAHHCLECASEARIAAIQAMRDNINGSLNGRVFTNYLAREWGVSPDDLYDYMWGVFEKIGPTEIWSDLRACAHGPEAGEAEMRAGRVTSAFEAAQARAARLSRSRQLTAVALIMTIVGIFATVIAMAGSNMLPLTRIIVLASFVAWELIALAIVLTAWIMRASVEGMQGE